MSRGGIRIVPSRITEARVARQYNISELAQKIGMTRQIISKYEQGVHSPTPDAIGKISRILDFPIDFFFKDDCSQSVEGVTFFRSRKTSQAKVRGMIKVKNSWTYEVYQLLNQYVELPPPNLPTLDLLIHKERLSKEDIEEAARLTRNFWNVGVGPINNLVSLLEKNGIIITNSNAVCEKADACSVIKDGVPIIFLGSGDKSACRVRLSLAHELGHIILHSYLTEEDMANPVIAKKIEEEANYFAGAFLLPFQEFANDVKSISLKYFMILKKKWRVSIGAMVYRCKELGIIDDQQSVYLNKQLSVKHWRTKEPLDDEIALELPMLFRKAMDLIFQNNVISIEEFVDSFCWKIKDLADICGCEENYFTRSPKFEVKLRLV